MSTYAHSNWHHLDRVPTDSPSGEMTGIGWVDAESNWFDGHFPEMPVLPGIAQLAMVQEIISGAMGKTVAVSGIRRIRFKRKIGPGERFTVAVSPMTKPNAFSFRILAEAEVACTGTLLIGEAVKNSK